MKVTLAAARINKKLTQKQLAKLVGVSHYTILNWEKGNSYPDIRYIKRLEEVLGASYDDLIFLSNNPL